MDSDAPLDRRCSAPFRRSLPFLHLIPPIASVLAGFDIAHSVPCWTGISIASLALSLAVDDDGGGDEAKQRRAKSSALDIARFHLSCLIAAIGAALLTGLGVQSMCAAMLTKIANEN